MELVCLAIDKTVLPCPCFTRASDVTKTNEQLPLVSHTWVAMSLGSSNFIPMVQIPSGTHLSTATLCFGKHSIMWKPLWWLTGGKLTPADVCSDVLVEQLRSPQPGEGQAVGTHLGSQERGGGGEGRGRRGEGGGERRGTESLVRRQGERGRQSGGGWSGRTLL